MDGKYCCVLIFSWNIGSTFFVEVEVEDLKVRENVEKVFNVELGRIFGTML